MVGHRESAGVILYKWNEGATDISKWYLCGKTGDEKEEGKVIS